MKLLRVHVISAATCGGLLDGFDLALRGANADSAKFDPLCLLGPNGAGKSQFLQVVAEIFQSIFCSIAPLEERTEGNPDLQFEIEYLICPENATSDVHVRVRKIALGRKKAVVEVHINLDGEWIERERTSDELLKLLPSKIVGYTSGGNETLSLPFFISRSGYASEVAARALGGESAEEAPLPDTRLMLIDYATHLEVLVANLLLASADQRLALMADARVNGLSSFRCVVQLAHAAVKKMSAHGKKIRTRKGIQLTEELERYLEQLQACATCYQYDEKTETYTFDFYVDAQSIKAFRSFWETSLSLYSALHKFAMLNDLVIPKATRERFKKDTMARRFASKLPEPQDEDKVFRFERVNFVAQDRREIVDYVSLSDGEHQLAQLLGTFAMISYSNVLFLLDEPESHFNPLWRVKFISNLLDLPYGKKNSRRLGGKAAMQDVLITTHSPFLPSDMIRENVLIFKKNAESGAVGFRRPEIETYGATFDAILDECFDVSPQISQLARNEIDAMLVSNDVSVIKETMRRLGDSVEKALLADRVRELSKKAS